MTVTRQTAGNRARISSLLLCGKPSSSRPTSSCAMPRRSNRSSKSWRRRVFQSCLVDFRPIHQCLSSNLSRTKQAPEEPNGTPRQSLRRQLARQVVLCVRAIQRHELTGPCARWKSQRVICQSKKKRHKVETKVGAGGWMAVDFD